MSGNMRLTYMTDMCTAQQVLQHWPSCSQHCTVHMQRSTLCCWSASAKQYAAHYGRMYVFALVCLKLVSSKDICSHSSASIAALAKLLTALHSAHAEEHIVLLVCFSKAVCCSLWQNVCICTGVLEASELKRHMQSQLSKYCSTGQSAHNTVLA